MNRLDPLKRILDKPVIILMTAALLTVVLLNFEFNALEAQLYDFRMMRGNTPEPSSNIVLITIDEATIKATSEFAPLPLDYHVKFLENLESYQPKAIGYLVNMNHVNQANPELFEGEYGPRFVESVRRFEQRGTPVILGTAFDVNGEVLPPYPLSALEHAIAVIHRDGNVFSGDKITRRALVELYGRPVFHSALARSSGLIAQDFEPKGTFGVPEADGKYFFFRYQFNGNKEDIFQYPQYSFSEILSKKIPQDALKGKILLVNTYSRQNPADAGMTPYLGFGANTPKVTIHADILDSMLRDNGIIRCPSWVTALITFLVILFVVSWVVQSTPLKGLIATLGLAGILFITGQILFSNLLHKNGYWLQISTPLMGILLGYYFVVPYRLIREYQKRSDYQRRHDVLVQVEELKTNFLSLITHDLKTPVARIQGLAEIVLRNAYDRLVANDIDNIHQIVNSTDELNRFISSILELTKVESSQFQLHLETKDINTLIENSIDGLKTHAKSKNILIQSKLEPLFPVKLDPSLMSKVISNLIDNAIKYSPPSSTIHVYSRELGDQIEVSIQDQGVGLSEEDQKSLFTRFFRARNEVTQNTAGTGLGLYLTKYFVEAHQGRVFVQSLPGKGSTFKILLPIHLNLHARKENSYVQSTRSG